MELEKQVISIELSKRLKELGVNSDSLFFWTKEGCGGAWNVVPTDQSFWDGYYSTRKMGIPAFTVTELYELILKLKPDFKLPDYFEPWALADGLAEMLIKIKSGVGVANVVEGI